MSVYSLLLVIHSYWRWPVLVLAIVVLMRAVIGVMTRRAWSNGDARVMRLFLISVDVQVLIGLILYFFFSPFWPSLYQAFGDTMRSPVARFFAIEHEMATFVATAIAHIGWSRARRATTDATKQRIVAVSMAVFFVLLLWAIPWPGGAVGRPLFRTTP
jgi:hypothetical protein